MTVPADSPPPDTLPADAETFDYIVVGSDFRVHGTRGLRAGDAAVFLRIPGFFIVTAIYRVAEKASAAILADAAPVSAPSHPDLRRVLTLLPRPRKPARPTAVQETR